MKKLTVLIVAVLVAAFLMSAAAIAQETKAKKQVSEKFLTMWKKVGHKTKEIKSFDTEKAVTVAGVRGAEAEDEALKLLYFKGGVKYPSQNELKVQIEILEDFVAKSPEDSTVAEIKYFIAVCYVELNDTEKATSFYQSIIDKHPKSDYAEMAKEDLDKIKK